MKTIPIALQAHYDSGSTTIANCWRVTLTNGTVYGFTDCDIDLHIDGLVYLAATGFTPTDMQNQTKLAVDNLQITGIFSSDVIDSADLLSGLWDYASIEMFRVNYENIGAGKEILGVNRLGEVTSNENSFQAEIRGLTNAYSQSVGDVYQAGCRATFCDAKCKLDINDYTLSGVVTGVSADGLTIYDTARTEADGTFSYGLMQMTSGESSGVSMEVKTYTVGTILLQLQFGRTIAVGDTYNIVIGCSKRFNADCVDRFNNAINFRGEPHLPGNDKVLRYAS